jgi:putative transposase
MPVFEAGGSCRPPAGITDPGYNGFDCALGETIDPSYKGPGYMHKHLRRLERIWVDWPIYFITTCTSKRRSILASKEVAKILVDEWRNAHDRHGWAIGRYVILPDHVHFFCSAELDARTLPTFMQAWKQWTSKRMARELKFSGNIWQEEFFDHVLRSSESYSQKWDYVKENPVRAGFVASSDQWPWQGEVESLML